MRALAIAMWLAFTLPVLPQGLEYSPLTPTAPQLEEYLARKHSPETGTAVRLLALGRDYNIDPRLVVAISGAETGFGVHVCAAFNAWNWFHHGNCPSSPFTAFEEGVEHVTRFLRLSYLNRGYDSIALIRMKYCATGCDNWTPLVTTFFNEMPVSSSPGTAPVTPTPLVTTPAPAPSAPPVPAGNNQVLGVPLYLVFFAGALGVGSWALRGFRR